MMSNRSSLSLYIHIPFCQSKCRYCSFVSKAGSDNEKNEYIEALKKEVIYRAKEYNMKYEISTIYIGGGTPSCLPDGSIRELMSTIYSYFTVKNDAEITIEINPESITKEKVKEYLLANINRFSVGLQSANDKILMLLGRLHTYDKYVKAIEMLKSEGITNISTDIMLGLPGQTVEIVEDTVSKVIKMGIPHVSAYMLSIEEGTVFDQLIDEGKMKLPSENLVIQEYNKTYEMLKNSGYERYEFSNFAKVGYRSKHNQVYWDRKDYLGIGVSAHSLIGSTRIANTEDTGKYIECINKMLLPLKEKSELTREEMKDEMVMLSLRTEKGIDTKAYKAEFCESLLSDKDDEINDLLKDDYLELTNNGYLKATDKGFLVLNHLIGILVAD